MAALTRRTWYTLVKALTAGGAKGWSRASAWRDERQRPDARSYEAK
jgi:hypothetical protein